MPIVVPIVTAIGGYAYAKYNEYFGDTDPATGKPKNKTAEAVKLALIAYGAYQLWQKIKK